jgi:hypothetical protein
MSFQSGEGHSHAWDMQTTSSTQQTIVDRLFGWWYILAAPSTSADTSLAHRGRFISLVLFIEIMSSLPGYFVVSSPQLFILLTISIITLAIGVFLNRMGKPVVASVLVVVILEISMSFYTLSVGGMKPELSSSALLRLIILMQPAVLAVAFFPARAALFIGTYNCACVEVALFFLPKTPEMVYDLSISGFAIYYVPISIQLLIILLSTLWANSTLREMKRAAHAEKVSQLAQDVMSNPTMLKQVLTRLQNAEQPPSSGLDDWSSEPWY